MQLITFANSLDPDQAHQNFRLDLDPFFLHSDHHQVFLKEFFDEVDFENNQQTTKSMKNFPGGKELTL